MGPATTVPVDTFSPLVAEWSKAVAIAVTVIRGCGFDPLRGHGQVPPWVWSIGRAVEPLYPTLWRFVAERMGLLSRLLQTRRMGLPGLLNLPLMALRLLGLMNMQFLNSVLGVWFVILLSSNLLLPWIWLIGNLVPSTLGLLRVTGV